MTRGESGLVVNSLAALAWLAFFFLNWVGALAAPVRNPQRPFAPVWVKSLISDRSEGAEASSFSPSMGKGPGEIYSKQNFSR